MDITGLLEGDIALVEECQNRRLMEHGFVRDTPIQIYKKLPGITCVQVRGAIIACRDYDLAKITVKEYTK
ncbi:TPA: hypothetical protein HA235_06015 [Candidatus Woesearchaeota archaeon]|nr:FeoA domain-containing protein [Candidatus Woesearchaeota archaeon]HIH32237.1 hypothetical protein [Candidatus Woesearchaeota archaeon]HIH54738.1 hypothetical protein [Candidatus Woesearchaeota archaeon]HIJ01440.1 hypothetical protein [Candidatus Woesearchaeota archaeon]HIJ14693.1 hypothetical protein [Candidatus Woesearchaeota archaeon]